VGVDRSLIGSSMEPFVVEVEKGAIRQFADAIGDSNPLYRDEAYALRHGYTGIVAPPTFPASFRPRTRQPWLVPLEEGRILAGEQVFSYERPVVAGDVLTCRFRFADLKEKHGRSGKLEFIVQELTAHDATGALVVTNTRVVIYRSPGALS
jgi:acyl dehydratase